MNTSRNLNSKSLENLHTKKPTIYICVEVKNREFYSQILLAEFIARAGFRCYVGTHAAIFALLRKKKDKSGIFFDKGTLPKSRMEWIKTKCEFIVVLDQEAGPTFNDPSKVNAQVLERLYPGSIPLIDRYFCIGPIIYKVAQSLFGKNADKVKMTGWPRIDLFRFYGKEIYSKEIQAIRRKYGKFLLFVSDFPVISMSKKYVGDGEDFEKTVQLLENAALSIKEWDANNRILPIIVRPHLTEDPRVWNSLLGKLKKTEVNKTSEITPWILASEGVIHRGSTTSIQAKLAGKPLYFLDTAAKIGLNTPQAQISDFVVNQSNPPLFYSQIANLQVKDDISTGILKSLILLEHDPAINRIVQEIVLLSPIHEKSISASTVILSQINARAFKRVVGLLLHEIKWILKLSVLPPYSAFVPHGLKRKEIERVVLSRGIKDLRTRFVTKNCWEITL